jgi:hypothetical protein
MSVRKQKYHRKGKRVLAQFKPGTVVRIRYFNLDHNQYVYLIHVELDETPGKEFKYMPQDVEALANNL